MNNTHHHEHIHDTNNQGLDRIQRVESETENQKRIREIEQEAALYQSAFQMELRNKMNALGDINRKLSDPNFTIDNLRTILENAGFRKIE